MSEIRVDNITDEAGTGKPGFPNGITATGAALTDPEITGGVYLGGTGSANYLDDYEEGTYSIQITDDSGNISSTNPTGNYTKVGKLVYVSGAIAGLSYGNFNSGDTVVISLPFTVETNTTFAVKIERTSLIGMYTIGVAGVSTSTFRLENINDNDKDDAVLVSNLGSNPNISFSVTYETNS